MFKKIILWAGINLVLLIALFLSLLQSPKQSSLEQEVSFSITGEALDEFRFGQVQLKKQDGIWVLNQKIKADAYMIEDLTKILANIELKRPIPKEEQERIKNLLQNNGISIQAYQYGTLLKEIRIGGEDIRTFGQIADEVFEIYTPNFNIVLYKVFALNPMDWRDKTLIALNWASVKKLSVKYTEKAQNNIYLSFDSAQFHLAGVQKIDSLKLFNYLRAFQSVRAFEYIDRQSFRDSLEKMQAFCEISVEDILPERNRTIFLYKTQPLYGKIMPSGDVFRLNKSFAKYLATPKDFEKP